MADPDPGLDVSGGVSGDGGDLPDLLRAVRLHQDGVDEFLVELVGDLPQGGEVVPEMGGVSGLYSVEELGKMFPEAFNKHGNNLEEGREMDAIGKIVEQIKKPDARSQQGLEGHVGPSDLSGCARAVKYTMLQEPQAPSKYNLAPKFGTAFHTMLAEAAYEAGYLHSEQHLTITLGDQIITGTADLIVPEENAVYDHKTVADLSWVAKHGADVKHIDQVHLYALGAVQAGLIDQSKAMGCVVYWDKSGTVDEPLTFWFDINWSRIDVLAEKYRSILRSDLDQIPYGEPLTFCLNLCPFAQVCRVDFFEAENHDDPDVYSAIEDLQQVKAEIKALEARKKEIEKELDPIPSGRYGDFSVKWVHISDTVIPEYNRRGYSYVRITQARKK